MKKKLEDMTDWERFEARMHRKGQAVRSVAVHEIRAPDLRPHQVAVTRALRNSGDTILLDVGMGK